MSFFLEKNISTVGSIKEKINETEHTESTSSSDVEYDSLIGSLKEELNKEESIELEEDINNLKNRADSVSSLTLRLIYPIQSPLHSLKGYAYDYGDSNSKFVTDTVIQYNSLGKPTLKQLDQPNPFLKHNKEKWPMEQSLIAVNLSIGEDPFSDENEIVTNNIFSEKLYDVLDWEKSVNQEYITTSELNSIYSIVIDDDETNGLSANSPKKGAQPTSCFKALSKTILNVFRRWGRHFQSNLNKNFNYTTLLPNRISLESASHSNIYETDVSSVGYEPVMQSYEEFTSIISNDYSIFKVDSALKFKSLCSDKSERVWEKTGKIPNLE